MFTRSRVLLLASVAALGGLLWVGSKQFAPPPAAGDEFTVSGPFTHGNLTVFLLHGPDAERSRPVLGLDEALARKCAVVHETGSVNELAVENTSEEDDLLLLSGDIVKGGRQDRVLQATMILPPKSGKVPVRSFCVEQSRWRKRGSEDDTRFAGNPGQIGGNELKKAVQLAGNQSEVWANVRAQQAALTKNVGTTVNNADSPTSLQLALENDQLQAEVAKFRDSITAQVGTPAGVVGFVTVVNGQVTGAEAFGSHAIFRKAWSKAVSAAAVEAVAARENRTFTEMTTGGVRTFLARAGEEARQSSDLEAQAEKTRATGYIAGATRETAVFFVNPAEPIGAPDGVVTGRIDSLRPYDSQVASPTPLNPSDPTRLYARNVRHNGPDNFDQGNIIDFDPQWVTQTGGLRRGNSFPDGSTAQQKGPPANTAVVEYREKGNGAVIHKSFLPR